MGIGGITRKAKTGYIGVNGIARRIKRGYVGVDGVARAMWTLGTPAYITTVNSFLDNGSQVHASTGAHAVFIDYTHVISVYDADMVKTTWGYQSDVYMSAGASTGMHAVISGGQMSDPNYARVAAYAFDRSGTKTQLSSLVQTMKGASGAQFDTRAVFACGLTDNYKGSTLPTAYTQSLTRESLPAMATGTVYEDCAMAANNAYLIITPYDLYDKNIVHAYSSTYTLNSTLSMTSARHGQKAARAGKYVVIGAKYNVKTNVDAFDDALTRISAPNFTITHPDSTAITLGDYAIFAGASGSQTTGIDMYDSYLTHTFLRFQVLSSTRQSEAAGETAYLITDDDEAMVLKLQ